MTEQEVRVRVHKAIVGLKPLRVLSTTSTKQGQKLTRADIVALREVGVAYVTAEMRSPADVQRDNLGHADYLCARAAATYDKPGAATRATLVASKSETTWRQETLLSSLRASLATCGHRMDARAKLLRAYRAAFAAVMPLHPDLVLALDRRLLTRRPDIPAPDRAVIIYRVASAVDPAYARVSTSNPVTTERTLQAHRRRQRRGDRDAKLLVILP
jgi:hypothetical protein